MQDPEKYQEAALRFITSILGATMGFLRSKQPKQTRINHLLAGICGGLIVVIVLDSVNLPKWAGYLICIFVSSYATAYWEAIGDIGMRIFTAFSEGFINKIFPNKPKKDDNV